MPTFNQLIRHGREEKRRMDRTRALDKCPQKTGVCPRISTRTPKKPNSAPRKIAKVRLSNRHDIFAHIPGEGHNSQVSIQYKTCGGRSSKAVAGRGPLVRVDCFHPQLLLLKVTCLLLKAWDETELVGASGPAVEGDIPTK